MGANNSRSSKCTAKPFLRKSAPPLCETNKVVRHTLLLSGLHGHIRGLRLGRLGIGLGGLLLLQREIDVDEDSKKLNTNLLGLARRGSLLLGELLLLLLKLGQLGGLLGLL